MHKYSIVIPQTALNDLDDIGDYIFRFTLDRTRVQKWRNILFGEIYGLGFFPSRFEKYNATYRRIVVGRKYKIIYKIEEAKKRVVIVRILRVERENID